MKAAEVMHLIEAKAGVSKNPEAMVPAPSSVPEFFTDCVRATGAKLLAEISEIEVSLATPMPIKKQSMPVSTAWLISGGKMHKLCITGLN